MYLQVRIDNNTVWTQGVCFVLVASVCTHRNDEISTLWPFLHFSSPCSSSSPGMSVSLQLRLSQHLPHTFAVCANHLIDKAAINEKTEISNTNRWWGGGLVGENSYLTKIMPHWLLLFTRLVNSFFQPFPLPLVIMSRVSHPLCLFFSCTFSWNSWSLFPEG